MKRMKVNPDICDRCASQVLEPLISAHLNSIRTLFSNAKSDEELLKVMADIERNCIALREVRIAKLQNDCPCKKGKPARFVHPKCPYQMEHTVMQDV